MSLVITLNQQKIIDAARRIIISKGMENLTVREIAGELDLTDGALYRHFAGKNEIVSLLIDDIESTLMDAIDEAAAISDSPMEKLENIFWSHLSYVEKRKGVSFIVFNNILSMKDRKLRSKVLEVIDAYLERIAVILKGGKSNRVFRADLNVEAASIAFFGIIQATVMHWGLSNYSYGLSKDKLRESFIVFKKGISVHS